MNTTLKTGRSGPKQAIYIGTKLEVPARSKQTPLATCPNLDIASIDTTPPSTFYLDLDAELAYWYSIHPHTPKEVAFLASHIQSLVRFRHTLNHTHSIIASFDAYLETHIKESPK
jgi:hypothetical protein